MKAAGTDAALAHTMPPSLPSRNRTRGGGTALAGGGLAARGLHRSRQLGSLRRRPATADCAASPPLRYVVPSLQAARSPPRLLLCTAAVDIDARKRGARTGMFSDATSCKSRGNFLQTWIFA